MSRTPEADDGRVLALLAEDLEAQSRRYPVWASVRGDRRHDHLLTDESPAAHQAWAEDARARLGRLEAVPWEGLSAERRVDAALLRRELTSRLEAWRFRDWLAPITQIDGPHEWLPELADRMGVRTRERREAWLARLRAFEPYGDQLLANLRAGLEAGLTPPRRVMAGAAGQCRAQATAAHEADPTTHPVYAPFRDLAGDDPQTRAARAVVLAVVVPVFRRLADFLEETYVPGCRESIAAVARPDGEAYYAWRLREHSTTAMSAREIHELGLAEVARIRREMDEAIARTAFPAGGRTGDALFRAFVEHLRTDRRFYHSTPEALVADYRDVAKRIDGELPRLFRRLPRNPYGVKAMSGEMAATAPTAYYFSGSLENGTPGWFMANTGRLDARPRYERVPLTLHEAVPGHHLQIALAKELEDVPEWRQEQGYTVYVEGWALYAERLGLEMGEGPRGLYADPYDDFGRLSYEMWRALRLVVDPGIHALGWSRERAVETMLASSALTRENVEREVDRYITWPGQAVAYKIGELRIRDLRRRAEEALGEGFDLRGFHDAVLGGGALPLDLLEERVMAWVAEARRGP
ncbi:MAG: DUF885 domain-containing protein [Planctomycetes bacterium]|nr:DUF885 domain-containing protein [Planctomycetota bacterium]